MSRDINLTVSTEGLAALADMALAPKNQSRLDDLLARNVVGKLSEDELQELDLLLKQIDELNLVKARAAVALRQFTTEE